jgi:diguanylate cyclase (GGDEF)-like protein
MVGVWIPATLAHASPPAPVPSTVLGSSPASLPVPEPSMQKLLPLAIDAARAERDIMREVRGLGGDMTEGMRMRLVEADRRGADLLLQLREQGFQPSPVVALVLGPLPHGFLPSPAGQPSPSGPAGQSAEAPTAEQYDVALLDLGGTGAVSPAPRVVVIEGTNPSAGSGSRGVSIAAMVAIVTAVALCGFAAVMLTRRRRNTALIDAATKDSLTGLFNRRRLDEDIQEYTQTAEQNVAALMIDVDHFKHFNDTHGHAIGDQVLRRVGVVVSNSVRSEDVVYRYGGEEFCVLLPRATPAEAAAIAERIRLRASAMQAVGSKSVTVSVGGAIGRGGQVRQTLELADQALYRAKRDGRDRIAMA